MIDDDLHELRAAGVGVVERSAAVSENAPVALFAEVYPFAADSVTSRIDKVQSPQVLDAWFASQLASLQTTPTCFMLEHWTSGTGRPEWLVIAPPADPGWLARLWRAVPRDSILLLSPDQRRLLFVFDQFDGHLRAVATETARVMAMRADRLRLDAALAATPGLLRVPMPPSPRALHARELVASAPTYTLALSSSDARREAWLADAFERWRRIPSPLDDRTDAETVGPYLFSLAGAETLATFGAYIETRSALTTLWRNAGYEQLAIIDADYTRALHLSRDSQRYAARIVTLVERPRSSG
jgi:hypothetical protein